MKTYCDTNILTAFVNRENLRNKFGREGVNKYGRISGFRSPNAGNKLENLSKCIIDKKALLSDLNGHDASMGAVLTASSLKNINIIDIDGEIEGKNIFDHACKKGDKNSKFYKRFCQKNRLRRNLDRNNLNDVRHFGSAIKSKSNIFLTANGKDFRPVIKFSDIKLEGI